MYDILDHPWLRIKNWTSQTILLLWTKTFCNRWKLTIAHFLSKILLQAMVTWLCSFDFSNSRPCLLYTEAMLLGKEWLLLGMKYPTLMFTKHLLICGNLLAVFSAMVMKDGVVHCNFDLRMTRAFDYRKWDVIFWSFVNLKVVIDPIYLLYILPYLKNWFFWWGPFSTSCTGFFFFSYPAGNMDTCFCSLLDLHSTPVDSHKLTV